MTAEATDETASQLLSLGEWHERLGEHFSALAAQRAAGGWPVFALEHGLELGEVMALKQAVRDALTIHAPSERHFLPWVVYAAEHGYRFAGHEFWPSFLKLTPGWNDRWRHYIRDSFKKFAASYYGAVPEGIWNENRPIISWPITHGILPHDLQEQLTRVLYEVSGSLEPWLFGDPLALGTHLQEEGRRCHTSMRYREFAEDPRLLGHITAALLIEEPEREVLSKRTLKRVVDDINSVRASAEFLTGARDTARYLRLRGLATRVDGNGRDRDGQAPALEIGSSLDALRARFILRPSADYEWDALVELPDLEPVARRGAVFRADLERCRARVDASAAKLLARGRLLGSGAQRLLLSDWPTSNAPLVELEGGSPDLRVLIGATLRALNGENHAFHVAADGMAYQQVSRVLRPGEQYVILRRDAVEKPVEGIRKARIRCAGIHAIQFTVPSVVDDLWQTLLANLDLRAAHSLEVWPVGLCPVAWDGGGEASWLESDEVLLGVRTDHLVDTIDVSLNGGAVRSIACDTQSSEPFTIVSVGRLLKGAYVVSIRTRSALSPSQPAGQLCVRIVSRLGTTSGRSERLPVALATYPAVPSLEDIWEGKMQLAVRGPTDSHIRCAITMRAGKPAKILFAKSTNRVRLPVTSESWDRLFQKYVRDDKAAGEAVEESSELSIVFEAGALGSCSVRAEREFAPLRWATRRVNREAKIALIDDAGALPVRVHFRPYERPDASEEIALADATEGLGCLFPGGLLIGTDGVRTGAAVYVPALRGLSQEQLRTVPAVPQARPEAAALVSLLLAAAEWQGARVKGDGIALEFRRRATRTLLAEVCSAVGGPTWRRAEQVWSADDSDGALATMKQSLTDHPDERIVGAMIIAGAQEWLPHDVAARLTTLTDGVARFARCTKTGLLAPMRQTGAVPLSAPAAHLAAIHELCEFALLVASSPVALANRYTMSEIETGLRRLLARPFILRGARLAVVAVHRCGVLLQASDALYAGWE